MKKSALINVNFEKGHALVTTKDAKVSFADMLGTIGGTFGVFLGLSFVGILDFIILTFSFFKKWLLFSIYASILLQVLLHNTWTLSAPKYTPTIHIQSILMAKRSVTQLRKATFS